MVEIRQANSRGDIDLIVRKHRLLYEKEYGFDHTFGDYVEESLLGKTERIWIGESDGAFAGCIGVVEADKQTAQLRWFLVEPEARGKGIGKALMEELLEYCRMKEYDHIFLWTVHKLPAARAIYERFGFHLTEEKPERVLWGQNLIEERWDLSLKRNR